MKIKNLRAINKGSLIASVDIELDSWGLTIRECLVRDGKFGMWVTMPSKQYEKDGKTNYYDLLIWEKEKGKAFQEAVMPLIKQELSAIDASTDVPF
jgi:DNA-binding cell septation regulator SpoVG